MSDDQIIAIVQAHKDGKLVQARPVCSSLWVDIDIGRPNWDFNNYEWRVAPEPRKPREWCVTVSKTDMTGSVRGGHVFRGHTCCSVDSDHEYVRVREVIE